MIHVTCRLTAKNRDQLRNHTLGNRVWATFTFIFTQISIQTAGLAFGGTGLCSYRVRGVDGSCAEHFTVESYTVFICQQSYLLLFGIPSPTHSFIPGLKPSFSANPSHCSPTFFFFRIHYMDSPDCLLLFLNISVFYF